MLGNIVLEASDLKRHYEIKRGAFRQPAILKALDGATFKLEKGRTLAVVGESGCGMSTLARLATMIEVPTAGERKIRNMILSKPIMQLFFVPRSGSLFMASYPHPLRSLPDVHSTLVTHL